MAQAMEAAVGGQMRTDGDTAECDLLVIGSGAAAFTAALTAATGGLRVLMVEKEEVFGGASARSGGCIWMPNTTHAKRAGGSDTREAALTFLRNEAKERYRAGPAEAFVDHGPAMVDFVEANSGVRFGFLAGFPDYHCETPGGSTEGRALYPMNWDAGPLGKELKRLRTPLQTGTFLGMQIGVQEAGIYMTAGRKLGSFIHVGKCILRRIRDQFRAGRTMWLALGNALVGGLAAAAFDRGVRLWTKAPARKLIVENGRVAGAVVAHDGRTVTVRARKGVVIGTGGFPHDAARRAALFPTGATASEVWGMFPTGNSGDGIRLGEAAGGVFDDNMLSPIALTPITRIDRVEGSVETMPCFFNRAMPGVIAVTRDGQRFTNEGRSYHDVGRDLLRKEAGEPEAVAWLVFDHRYLRRWGNGPIRPAPIPFKPYIKTGYLKTGRTVEELAAATGIDPTGLRATIDRYNRFARDGNDPDFHRGESIFDQVSGDAEHKPNPCVGPIDAAPYYAIRVFAGCVGTFAGLRANGHAQVETADGVPIEGLYVVGNDMASITGGDYVAGGCTLGPGMTFGYLAARHALGLSGDEAVVPATTGRAGR